MNDFPDDINLDETEKLFEQIAASDCLEDQEAVEVRMSGTLLPILVQHFACPCLLDTSWSAQDVAKRMKEFLDACADLQIV